MLAKQLASTFYAVALFVAGRGLSAAAPGNIVEQPDPKRQIEGGTARQTEPVGEPSGGSGGWPPRSWRP